MVFGVAAVVVMLLTFDVSPAQIADMLRRTGIIFPLCVLLWLVIYIMNAVSWRVIINHNGDEKVPFGPVFRMTISGFALNYTTPFGLMGGEPYRILELTPYTGVERATGSVVLYVMMHIYSHFWFWMSAVVLYVILHFAAPGKYLLPVSFIIAFVLFTAVFVLMLYLFGKGYRNGFLLKFLRFLGKFPLIGKPITRFTDNNIRKISDTDNQIANLHACGKSAFFWSLFLEFAARAAGCLEYWLIMCNLVPQSTYFDAYLIVAFSSLFSNILFFIPMQMGSKEGSVAMASSGLAIGGPVGLFTALVTRVREAVWIIIGVVLMFCNKKRTCERTDI